VRKLNYSRHDINTIPKTNLVLDPTLKKKEEIVELIIQRFMTKMKYPILAFDGYIGANWEMIFKIKELLENQDIQVKLIDSRYFYKDPNNIWDIIQPFISFDPHFGKMFKGKLEDLLDEEKIEIIKKTINKTNKEVIIVYGCGSVNNYMNNEYDLIFYSDVTHENLLNYLKEEKLWFIPENVSPENGVADVGMSIQTFKLTRYILIPIFNEHRRTLLKKMDFYIENNNNLKILPKLSFKHLMLELAQRPFKLKPLYIQSPWGGDWMRGKRGLPINFNNLAWTFEAVTSDMSLLVNFEGDTFEIPFDSFLASNPKTIMGEKAFKKYKYFFPIRVHYDDSYNGGNMAIQVHPDDSYVKKFFSENVGQQEAYYIVETKNSSKVFLGLKKDTDLKKFYEEALKSKDMKVVLEYEKYVNAFSSKAGDLFLIPSGTIHALGKDQVCLEIGTSYGYTFHVYDYLRPDLNGNLREIHLEHAFRMLYSKLQINKEPSNLKPQPIMIDKCDDSAEYLLGKRNDMIFEVRRVDFKEKWEDNTNGNFQVLTLIKGEKLFIKPKNKVLGMTTLQNLRTIIIPATLGNYVLESDESCTVIKVTLTK